MGTQEAKKIVVLHEGKKYTITFIEKPKIKTTVYDENMEISSKSAIEVMRSELKRIGLEEVGNSNNNFKRIWKFYNPNLTKLNTNIKNKKNSETIEVEVPMEISNEIKRLGKLWNESEINPKNDKEVMNSWDKLIDEWSESEKLPLIIRKQSKISGQEITHHSGRKIVFSDNSPAQWVYFHVLKHEKLSLKEIREALSQDSLPMSYANTASEKAQKKYLCTSGGKNVNSQGWKLCHIENVGLNTRQAVEILDIEILKGAFRRLMKPSNMFLLPKQIGGIGEIKEFIDEQR